MTEIQKQTKLITLPPWSKMDIVVLSFKREKNVPPTQIELSQVSYSLQWLILRLVRIYKLRINFLYHTQELNHQKSSVKKLRKNLIRKSFKVLDWTLFIGFCMLAGHFMIGVIAEYQAKKSGFAQSLEPIKELPTIVFCLDGTKTWRYGEMLNISYYAKGKYINNLNAGKVYEVESGSETVQVEQIRTLGCRTHLLQLFKLSKKVLISEIFIWCYPILWSEIRWFWGKKLCS